MVTFAWTQRDRFIKMITAMCNIPYTHKMYMGKRSSLTNQSVEENDKQASVVVSINNLCALNIDDFVKS